MHVEENAVSPGNEAAPEHKVPSTLEGLKRRAKKLKKERGITHTQALELASQSMGYQTYKAAFRDLNPNDGAAQEQC